MLAYPQKGEVCPRARNGPDSAVPSLAGGTADSPRGHPRFTGGLLVRHAGELRMHHDVGMIRVMEAFFAARDEGERLEAEDRSYRLLGELADLEVVLFLNLAGRALNRTSMTITQTRSTCSKARLSSL